MTIQIDIFCFPLISLKQLLRHMLKKTEMDMSCVERVELGSFIGHNELLSAWILKPLVSHFNILRGCLCFFSPFF